MPRIKTSVYCRGRKRILPLMRIVANTLIKDMLAGEENNTFI